MLSFVLATLVLGLVAGYLAGLLGIGGGLVIVPSLLYLMQALLNLPFEQAMPMAIATSLGTIIFTGLSSTRTHWKLGQVSWPLFWPIGSGIALGAVLGAWLAASVPATYLKWFFAIVLLLLAARMALATVPEGQAKPHRGLLGISGGIIGTISAIMGIGGGALVVPTLVYFKVSVKQAIGCAAACGIVIAVFGSVSFMLAGWQRADLPTWSLGYVYLPALLGIVSTSMLTARFGARMSHRLPTKILKRVFAVCLVVVSCRMMLG
ncbi:UPF0721 transmembrane protein [Saliniradius amylolyticus]|uniref:Probable membrane transporter protein n=1 Tax=Saliniradius amylolyticus TaxID=2183582 RepID=A0A2S2E0A2_9ALTE|nr:sulfite exporter TauE/SafE family protein [Saliniradius amylolyticus]AWL11043.1 UPF0721 transmembrane protein [Saliniradius amylolyticus]